MQHLHLTSSKILYTTICCPHCCQDRGFTYPVLHSERVKILPSMAKITKKIDIITQSARLSDKDFLNYRLPVVDSTFIVLAGGRCHQRGDPLNGISHDSCNFYFQIKFLLNKMIYLCDVEESIYN